MKKILVMSNDPILKRKNLEAIAASGFQVADVSDALDGLLLVDKNGFGVIIIDEELADIDGYRASQKIRQYSQIPIILLGTEQSDEVWAKIDELGFDVYLKKPVSPRELVAQLKSLLRRAHPEEKIQSIQTIKEAEVQSITVAPETEEYVVKIEKPVTDQVEMPAKVQPVKAISIQETESLKFTKSDKPELPFRTMDLKSEPASLRETASIRLDKTAGIEKISQMQKPAEVVSIKAPLSSHDYKTAQTKKPAEAEPIVKKVKPFETTPTIVTALNEVKSVNLDGIIGSSSSSKDELFSYGTWSDSGMNKLIEALANASLAEIRPIVNSSVKGGFTYPEVDRLLGTTGEETRSVLERLASDQVLKKTPFEKIYIDPDGGVQLVPVERCPHCSSGNLTRGQLVEHFSCGNVGMDQDYKIDYQYVCPKCGKELRLLGTDYRNIGIRYKCMDCNELFPTPVMKWRNLITGKIWSFEELREIQIYAYSVCPEKKEWLVFQLKPKTQLVNLLRLQGYQVEEHAKIHGSSGAVHTIDILATRDDGLAKYHIGIGILIASRSAEEIGLEELFEFDTKAYDVGISYKVAIVIPKLNREAAKFAERQNIAVLEANDPSMLLSFLEKHISLLSGVRARASLLTQGAMIGPLGKAVGFLKQRGYDIFENVRVLGKSGAEHILDILAQRDDILVKPAIAIAAVSSEQGQGIGIDKVSQFDAKAYDTGIRNKVMVALAPLTQEARQFASQQRIRIFEEHEVENIIRSWMAT